MPCPNFSHHQLHLQRESYTYPAVALERIFDGFNVIPFMSTIGMDNYFNQLLLSPTEDQKILGYLGVIFWGHYSGRKGYITEQRALAKVRLAYRGQNRTRRGHVEHIRGVIDIGIGAVSFYIDEAVDKIEHNDYGNALSILIRLPQVNIAFASKICAFINPKKCGVIDSVIARNMPQFSFILMNGYVRNNTANRNRYVEYCSCLQLAASELNVDPEHSVWTDRDGTEHPWRAVDIERALYL